MDEENDAGAAHCCKNLQTQEEFFSDSCQSNERTSDISIKGPHLKVEQTNDWRKKRNFVDQIFRSCGLKAIQPPDKK